MPVPRPRSEEPPATVQSLARLMEPGSYTGPDMDGVELPRGDVTEGVVKVGETVRRPRQPTSPAVAAYLTHLRADGFDGAPRFLGTDDRGRDVLDFMPGCTAGTELDEWVADETLLASVATLVRALMEASLGFPLHLRGAPWFSDLLGGDEPGWPVVVDPTVVSHCDITPQNVVVDADDHTRAVALIDFDLAGPSSPLKEAANIAFHWAQPCPPEDRAGVFADLDAASRVRLIADGIGLDAAGRRDLPAVMSSATELSWLRMRRNASALGGGWARMWDDGVGEVIRRRGAWLAQRREDLLDVLLDGIEPGELP